MEMTHTTDGSHSGPEHAHTVTIVVDRNPREIRPGTYVVADFKERLGIDSCKELDEIVCEEFKPLDDSAKVHVKGGEQFVTHARCGGSS